MKGTDLEAMAARVAHGPGPEAGLGELLSELDDKYGLVAISVADGLLLPTAMALAESSRKEASVRAASEMRACIRVLDRLLESAGAERHRRS